MQVFAIANDFDKVLNRRFGILEVCVTLPQHARARALSRTLALRPFSAEAVGIALRDEKKIV